MRPSFRPLAAPRGWRSGRWRRRSPTSGDGLIREGAPGQEAVIALNTAFMTDGAVVRIAKGAVLDKPLLLVFARAGGKGASSPRATSSSWARRPRDRHRGPRGAAGRRARPGQYAERGVGRRGARLAHIKCTLAGKAASHLATWLATLGQGATYHAFQLTAATGLARNNLFATFKGEGAKLDISGSFLGRGAEHIDTTLVVDHAVPRCESRELFKGVLADRAHGVFQGKVIVRPERAEERRQADGPGADAVGGRRVRFQAGARDLRRRRGLRPRLDGGRDRRGFAVLHALARHTAGGGARAADRKLHRRCHRQGRGRAPARGACRPSHAPAGEPRAHEARRCASGGERT